MLHDNSFQSNRTLNKYRENEKVMEAYKLYGHLTDREVSEKTGVFIVNVRRAITNLIKDGHVKEYDKAKCSYTGRTVRVCGRSHKFCKTDLFDKT